MKHGADKDITSDDGERPIDLVDPQDFEMVAVMLAPSLNANKNSDVDDDDVSGEEVDLNQPASKR